MKIIFRLSFILSLCPWLGIADQVLLTPSDDCTIYEADAVSNGNGDKFFVSTDSNGSPRRALIKFDISGNLPSGATINSVALTVTRVGGRNLSQLNTLNRVTTSWVEATTNGDGGAGGGGGGKGSAANDGDPTWEAPSFNLGPDWTTPGGDFNAVNSASQTIGANGDYTFTDVPMASDVQAWLDGAQNNDGWIIRGNEGATNESIQYASRESGVAANRPQLLVDYSPAALPGPVVPVIVSTNLMINHATDVVNDDRWPNLTPVTTLGGLDRIMTNLTASAPFPTLITNSLRTLNRIESYYRFATNGQPVAMLGLTGADNAYGDANQFGNAFGTRNASFEIWFRPTSTNGGAQILWETGGGTGASFTLFDNIMTFNTRSQNIRHLVTNDIGSLIENFEFIQAVGTVRLEDGIEGVELFVNGASVGVHTNAGPNNDWEGGDGDGLGGRGENNLGGRGNGFSYDGSSYESFSGDIAIWRVYVETNAVTQSGAVLSPAGVLQNYQAIVPNTVVYDAEAGNTAWTNGPNWGVLGNSATDLVPVAGENVYIGNGANNQATQGPTIDTAVAGPHNLFLGHNLGSFDGFGNLSLNAGADLVITNNLYLGSDNSQGDVYHNDGRMVVGGDFIYGQQPSTRGGEYRLRGGTLEVMGDIMERVVGVDTAQMYVDGGELIVHGTNMVFQSFRVGQEAGRVGHFTIQPGKRLRNTGTMVIGNNGIGTLNINGELINGTTRISDQAGGAGSIVNVGTPAQEGRWNISGAQLDIGHRGTGTLNLTNGLVNASTTIRFGENNTNPGPTLNIAGGVFAANGQIQDVNNQGLIQVGNGELDLSQANATSRQVSQLNMGTGSVLRVSVFNDTTGLNPLEVLNTASFAAGAAIAIEDNRNLSAGGGTPVTWIGASSTWDTQVVNWVNNQGDNLLPAQALNALLAGAEFPFLTSPTLVDASLLSAATPGWSVTSTATTVSMVRDSTLAGGPVLATITNLASVVMRTNDLNLAATLGADAAALQIDTGALILSNLVGGVNLQLGGSNSQGTVTHNGGDVHVSGDLIYGPGATLPGGSYTLNSGILTIAGSIVETDTAVANAQFLFNGGTLDVGGSISVQRFSIADSGSANVVYTSTVPITTSGTWSIGGNDTSTGTFIMDDPTDSASALNATLGFNGFAQGTFLMRDGFFEVTGGKFGIGGDNNNDTNVVGTLILGEAGSTNNPLIEVTGGNTELGQGNIGNLTLHGGTLRQISNNLVIGQGPNGIGFLTVNGGTLAINGGAIDNRNLNVNNGSAVININDGEVFIGQHLNLGVAASSSCVLTITNGLLSIGGNLDYRSNGNDTINFSGGEILFTQTRAGDVLIGNRTGTNIFDWTGGTLKNVRTWNGDLHQQGGVLELGASIGSMTITGNYTSAPPASLAVELTTTNHDQLVVQGDLDLNGMTLDLSLLDPAVTNLPNGTRYILIDGSTPPTGQFAQGTTLFVEGAEFSIDYGGLSGDDVEIIVGTSIDLTQDSDLDDIPDVLELAFGTNPNDDTSGQEGLPRIERDGSNVNVIFRKLVDPSPYTYFIESSIDLLGAYTMEVVSPVLSADQTGLPAGVERMEATFPTSPELYKAYRVGVNL